MLEIENLVGGYPGTRVLDGLSLDIPEGAVLCLLGRNGVGKSTFVNAVMGLTSATGSVRFRGTELAGQRPDTIARAGLALVPQGRRVFGPLTVDENLQIVAKAHRARRGSWTPSAVYELFPRLAERRRNRGDQLSGGEQEMLAIGRALVTNPRLLLMDEPSDGLAPSIVELVGDVIDSLSADGVTVLLVEQNLNLAFRVATDLAVMKKGRVVFRGAPEQLRDDSTLLQELLGVGV